MSETVPVLPQAAGYGVVVGMGLFFSAFMIGLTWMQTRYTSHKTSNAEEFNSASRSVKPGLIAAGIVSAWTWAATLLQSSAVAYKFGISGPWWYAAGATVQVLLFAMIAAKLKQNAPNAHTFLEIIRLRWGKFAHCVFLFFGLSTNIIVSTMLILGGSGTVTDLTGMPTIAACMLIPFVVAIYVMAGGMRATLVADYTHTAVLFAIIMTFLFTVYATSPLIGSFARMHELLEQATAEKPVSGNAGGSYLTMRSKNGLIFGVINIVGNFATVFGDQAYFQRAIASDPRTCVKSFLMGGLAWFAIPFAFATTLGLAAVALSHGENPLVRLTAAEVSAGLPAPKAAAALMGQSGAIAMLVLLFLAVTSAASAEQIATSSIFTYDIYGTYINKNPSEKQILWVSHLSIGGFALIMGISAIIFKYIGVSMGWLYEFMGTALGSCVVPIAMAISHPRANGVGCVAGALIGFSAGIAGWLICTAKLNDGVLNVTTLGGDYEMLTGNLLSLGVGGIVSMVWTQLRPVDFDWDITRQGIKTVSQGDITRDEDAADGEGTGTPLDEDKQADEKFDGRAHDAAVLESSEVDAAREERVGLQRAFRFAAASALTLTLVFVILIPLPLFFASTIYGVKGFSAWVSIGIVWIFVGAALVVVYPLWESRAGIAQVFHGVYLDIFAKGTGRYNGA